MERKSKQFFYITTNFDVVKTTGFEYTEGNGVNYNYWWCPEVGVSAQVGVHLFEDRAEAIRMALKSARDERNKLDYTISKLEDS